MTVERLLWQLEQIRRHKGYEDAMEYPIQIEQLVPERLIDVTHVSLVTEGDRTYVRLDSELNNHGALRL